ncbi:MAG: DUF362 domain-containing protein [Candidatus Zixiibacteriota bacterium]|nr:MAG: DUF362 domain-containing protein [candidate division Zixibacteria bacterium]
MRLPTVSVAHFDGCTTHDYQAGVEAALSYLGSIGRFVKPGQRVLLKPDLMYDYPGGCGYTSSPQFVAAVARAVSDVGAAVIVGDSPFVLRGNITDFWRVAGILDAAEQGHFELVNFEMSGSQAVALETRVYYISRAVLEADAVINLPRLKYDRWTGFAGGIRNMLGTLPGFQKGRLYKEVSGGRELADIMVDIFSVVRPVLTIAEAVPVNLDETSLSRGGAYIVASSDTVAIDTVLSEMLRLDQTKIHTTRAAADAGLGIGWAEAIRLAGSPLNLTGNEFRQHSPVGRKAVLRKMARGIVEPYVWMKSSVNGDLCSGCGTCLDSCPTKAIQMPVGTSTPRINYNLCICCWAGLANCPTQAIYLEESRAVRKLFPVSSHSRDATSIS